LVLALGCRGADDEAARLELASPDWRLAGHYELVAGASPGELLPAALAPTDPLRACVESDRTADTSQWEGAVYAPGEATDRDFVPPIRRAGAVLCFATPEVEIESVSTSFCLSLRDRYTGHESELGCRPIRHVADPEEYLAFDRELKELLQGHGAMTPPELIDALDDLGARIRTAGYPLLGLRIRLISVYFLRRDGGEEGRAKAWTRLTDLPSWLSEPGAESWLGETALERANVLMFQGRLRAAWKELREADRAYLLTAHEKRLGVVQRQGEILSRVGAPGEGISRLSSALADCATSPCLDSLQASARISLAWWLVQSPSASIEEVTAAARVLDADLEAESGDSDPLEVANAAMNLALLEQRSGVDPRATLTRVRSAVSDRPGGRAEHLRDWAELVEATWELTVSPSGSLERAMAVAGSTATPDVAAWAWSLVGRAQRRLGDLETAADAFARALTFHEFLAGSALEQAIPLGDSLEADDAYRSARVAVDRGEFEIAWETLSRLGKREGLRSAATDGSPCAEEQPERSERRRDLLQQLLELERPASKPRRAQREPIRRAVMTELQELARIPLGCAEATVVVEPRFRAFALADEVILLERSARGEVALARRSKISLEQIVAAAEKIAEGWTSPMGETGEPPMSDATWRQLVHPIAAALLPPQSEELEELTVFSLHGALQGIPLEALPLGEADGTRWLSDVTTVLLDAGPSLRSDRTAGPEGAEPYLFVVDPEGNLSGGARLASRLDELLPGAVVLERETATRERTLAAMPSSRWLHVGAHGEYDPAFPDLSSLRLADGKLLAFDLAESARHLLGANLSACHSGRWEWTAGGAGYGLAGMVSRLGVPWVIASRGPLADDLAFRLNEELYRSLGSGRSPATAYQEAMQEVREEFPAAVWSSVLLLGRTTLKEQLVAGGQTAWVTIPNGVERHAADTVRGGDA